MLARRLAPCAPVAATSPQAQSPAARCAPGRPRRCRPCGGSAAAPPGIGSTRGSRPRLLAQGEDCRETFGETLPRPPPGRPRKTHVPALRRRQIARATTSRGASPRRPAVLSSMKRRPEPSIQDRPLAAQGLREERQRGAAVRPDRQGRGVELHELQIDQPGAGPRRHGEAVAGRLDQVGADGGTTGRGRRSPGPRPVPGRAGGSRPTADRGQPDDPSPVLDQIDGEGLVHHPHFEGTLAHRLDRGSARSRRRSRRRARGGSAAGCGRPRGPERGRRPRSPSNWAPSASRAWTRSGPSPVSSSTTAGSLSPAPAAIVSAACRAGASSSPTATATPPWAQTLDPPLPSRALVSTVTDSGARPAPRSARPRFRPDHQHVKEQEISSKP